MREEILTIQEVAALMKIADKTVYTMAQRGEIPAFKVRGQWRVRRDDLDGWMKEQVSGARASGARKAREAPKPRRTSKSARGTEEAANHGR